MASTGVALLCAVGNVAIDVTLLLWLTGVLVTSVVLLYLRTPQGSTEEVVIGFLSLVWPVLVAALAVVWFAKVVAFLIIDPVILRHRESVRSRSEEV